MAMLVVLLLHGTCDICGQSHPLSNHGAHAATLGASSRHGETSPSVTLLVKGQDLVPQWRDLVQPGQDINLIGLEKQRLYTGDGPGEGHVTVLRIRQHPAQAMAWLMRRSVLQSTVDTGESCSSPGIMSFGTIALPVSKDITPPDSVSAWLGSCSSTSTVSPCMETTSRHESGSCITYNGTVTRVTSSAIILDNDPQTTLWWLPLQGKLARPRLPATLRVGCRATFHNVHPLIAGQSLVGLGWCNASMVTVSDLSGGWLDLGSTERGNWTALSRSSLSAEHDATRTVTHIERLCARSLHSNAPACVWFQACTQRLVSAGLVHDFASLPMGRYDLTGTALSAAEYEAWLQLQDAVRSILELEGGEHRTHLTADDALRHPLSRCASGLPSFDLLTRACEKSELWDGEENVPCTHNE